MKPVPSALKIVDFAVLEMHFEFVTSKHMQKNIVPSAYFQDYELDLDFDMFRQKIIRTVMSVKINDVENPLPGYKITAKVATLFQFNDAIEVTPEEKRSIEGFSTIYMSLNNLRGIVSGFTANAPFGRYTLPSIDLNDLIKKKQAAMVLPEVKKKLTRAGKKKLIEKQTK